MLQWGNGEMWARRSQRSILPTWDQEVTPGLAWVSKRDHSRYDSDKPCSQELKQKRLSIPEGEGHPRNCPLYPSSMDLIFWYFYLLALTFKSEPHRANRQYYRAQGLRPGWAIGKQLEKDPGLEREGATESGAYGTGKGGTPLERSFRVRLHAQRGVCWDSLSLSAPLPTSLSNK